VLFLSISLMSIGIAKAQLQSDSILIDTHFRSFHYASDTKVKANASLVFVLHGSGGSGTQIMTGAKKLAAIADAENIVLVYPDGYHRYWNECRKASTAEANQENINEEAFFENMIQYFRKKYRIDTKKVFVVGTSGGGHMAYKLALTMPKN